MPMYDYKCTKCGHEFEGIHKAEESVPCRRCNGATVKLISPVRINLDGTDPAFSTAWDKWEKTRNEKMRKTESDPDWGIS